MQAQDGVTFSNVGATTGPFDLAGGLYGVHVVATFGGGSVTLQKLAADGTWAATLTAFTANGYATVNLPRHIPSGDRHSYRRLRLDCPRTGGVM